MGISGRTYCGMDTLLALDNTRCRSSPINLPRAPTPVIVSALWSAMQHHPDQRLAGYILSGLTNGFRIGFDRRCRLRCNGRNHPSSTEQPLIVQQHIELEQARGSLVGPLSPSLATTVHVSPLGLVPKPHSDKWRLIVDLSSPEGRSVNDGICSDLTSVVYASVDNAVEIIRRLGPGTELVKMDLKDAYRVIPVHPQDHHLLGIQWCGDTFIDRSLPFGLRSAPKIFTAFSDMVAWAIHYRGVRHLLHYLDDFLLFGQPGTLEASQAVATAREVFAEAGIPVAEHKTDGPATSVTFLGILVDTVLFQLRLPADKLARLQVMVRQWLDRRSCTRRELESLTGHLAHAAIVIRPGRIFLRPLFALIATAAKPHHYVHLNLSVRADLRWWLHLLQAWNGSSFFPPPLPSVHMYSDASGSFGCGAFNRPHGWFQLQWPPSWLSVNIATKEFVPVVTAAALWGRLWAGAHVCFHVDNLAVVSILNKRSARDPLLSHLLRCLFFFSAFYKFHFSAEHIPGTSNTAADALSRDNIHLFSLLVPQVQQVTVPASVQELLLRESPDWTSPRWTSLFCRSLPRDLLPPHLRHIGQE